MGIGKYRHLKIVRPESYAVELHIKHCEFVLSQPSQASVWV